MLSTAPLQVSTSDEWSPLKSVIVGRASHSMFPHEHSRMIASTMSAKYLNEFRPGNPFPPYITAAADKELDKFCAILEGQGIKVFRPRVVDWATVGGYTGSMVRDGLLVVGSTIIESAFSWRCREHEVDLLLEDLLFELAKDERVTIHRAPKPPARETLYDGHPAIGANGINPINGVPWAINNSRPAFDAADFLRCGKYVIGQLSHVTNMEGIEYVRSRLPEGYQLELLELNDPSAMHLDASILPLREGLLIYNPTRVSCEALDKIPFLASWECKPFPFTPKPRIEPPSYMTSDWLVMNLLVLGPHKVMVDESDLEFAEFLKECGMEVILCPFRHVNSLGGSFHCATVDLVRAEEVNGSS